MFGILLRQLIVAKKGSGLLDVRFEPSNQTNYVSDDSSFVTQYPYIPSGIIFSLLLSPNITKRQLIMLQFTPMAK